MNLKIEPRGLPVDGVHLEGQLPASIFDLSDSDAPKPVSPLTLSIDVIRDDDDLVVTGRVSATFELVCGRCAERFQQEMVLDPYESLVPIENDDPIDLTTWLREDMLLALPPHPRCENGNVTPRECPAEGRFDPTADAAGEGSDEAQGSRAWDALDQLSNLKRN
jgi:uncharacterized metal-binding protein YceD (DUF177 family)